MAYKDFTSLNGLIKEAVQPAVARNINDLVTVAASETSTINTVASRYARLYATVEELVTDASQTPPAVEDVTPISRQSVPNSAISDAINVMNQAQEQMQRLENLINAAGEQVQSEAMSGFISYNGGVLVPLYFRNPADNAQVIAEQYIRTLTVDSNNFKFSLHSVHDTSDRSILGQRPTQRALGSMAFRDDATTHIVVNDTIIGNIDGSPVHIATISNENLATAATAVGVVVWFQTGSVRHFLAFPSVSRGTQYEVPLLDLSSWTTLNAGRAQYADLCRYVGIAGSNIYNSWGTVVGRRHYYWDGSQVSSAEIGMDYLPAYYYDGLVTTQPSRIVGLGTAILHAVRVSNADSIENILTQMLE